MSQRHRHKQRTEVERAHSSLDMRSDGQRHGMQIRTGPLPSPEDFQHYEAVLPGAAERLLTMAENQQRQRHTIELEDAQHDRSQEKAGMKWGAALTAGGMLFAFLALLAVLGSGTYLLLQGKDLAGYTALVTATVAIIGVFVKASLVKQRRPPAGEE